MKKSILIVGPYLPGKSFGGPVKSLLNLVETLSDYFDFYVITTDRDQKSKMVYNDVKIGSWNQVGSAKVFYVPKGKNNLKYICNVLKEIKYDLVYTSSLFSTQSMIIQLLKYFNNIKNPVIVAPRGELSSGALAIKSKKKKIFLLLYKMLNIHTKLSYTCTSLKDKQDILNLLGHNIKIYKAGNIINNDFKKEITKRDKHSGRLRIATVSRISKIKNIDYSLHLLKVIDESNYSFKEIVFDIYGPLEEEDYWSNCRSIINKLSNKIIVNYMGAIDYNEVINILSNYHIFLFPTKGENFGHVIQEAFLSGSPVITSDQTPWRKLEDLEVGFDISLGNKDQYINAIKFYLDMDDKGYELASNKAYKYGIYKVESQLSIKEHLDMFNSEFAK